MSKRNKETSTSAQRNPIAVAMRLRYGRTTTVMKDRRKRREKDARKSWKSDNDTA